MNLLRSSEARSDLALAFRSSAGLLLCFGWILGGCTAPASDPPADSGGTETSAATTPETGVIRALVAGDRGCYVTLEDVQGRSSEAVGSYELCEQTELVGQRVQLTREPTPILAMSCEGDQECVRRDTVDLIVSAEKLP